jgi:ankyrin repeat protein
MEGSAKNVDDFRLLIEAGDVDGIQRALGADPALANRTIRWSLNQENESDPLHFVSDCFFNGWLRNGREGRIAEILLAHGAAIDGTGNRESPLIGSASLGAEMVSKVLLDAGAATEKTSIFGARALHWAAWIGTPASVELIVAHNANVEARCSEFGATPLYWAVHGYGPNGPKQKRDQIAAARILIRAGASVETSNSRGISALELARHCERRDMYELLQQYAASE